MTDTTKCCGKCKYANFGKAYPHVGICNYYLFVGTPRSPFWMNFSNTNGVISKESGIDCPTFSPKEEEKEV